MQELEIAQKCFLDSVIRRIGRPQPTQREPPKCTAIAPDNVFELVALTIKYGSDKHAVAERCFESVTVCCGLTRTCVAHAAGAAEACDHDSYRAWQTKKSNRSVARFHGNPGYQQNLTRMAADAHPPGRREKNNKESAETELPDAGMVPTTSQPSAATGEA